jgi:uncharacterized C2H2 Zn-finger protein
MMELYLNAQAIYIIYFSRKGRLNLNEVKKRSRMRRLKATVLKDESMVVKCPRCNNGIFIYPKLDDGTEGPHAHLPNSEVKIKHSGKKGVFEIHPPNIVCINRKDNQYCTWSGDIYLTN